MDHGMDSGWVWPGPPPPMGTAGNAQKWLCLFLPIGAKTTEPNGLKFGMGEGMDCGTVYEWVWASPPLRWVWQKNAQNSVSA